MKRLLCRWIEYYLALCEDDIERGLPSWVRRHVQACAHCQAELQTYRRAHEAVRQYAGLLPDSPPTGWRPLQMSETVRRRAFPLQFALAPLAAVVVATIGFVLWQKMLVPGDEMGAPTQVAQGGAPRQPKTSITDTKPVAPTTTPSTKGTTPKQQPMKPLPSPEQSKPAPAPSQSPPAYHPPKRIVIAAQTKQETAPATDAKPAAEPLLEPAIPVQPVVAEAHPVSSAPVPEGYVIEAAYPATAGAVE